MHHLRCCTDYFAGTFNSRQQFCGSLFQVQSTTLFRLLVKGLKSKDAVRLLVKGLKLMHAVIQKFSPASTFLDDPRGRQDTHETSRKSVASQALGCPQHCSQETAYHMYLAQCC